MKIIYLFSLFIFINGTVADFESYEVNQEVSKEKKSKRCGPKYTAEDESSGCRSSEETTTPFKKYKIIQKVTTKMPISIPRGPLYDFIVNICNTLLTKFSHDKIPKYFKILSKSLRGFGSDFPMKIKLNKFCDKLKKLSDQNGNTLKEKVIQFLGIMTEGNPFLNDFFYAINPIYKIWDDNEMDDYIFLLRQYGQDQTSHIGQNTHEIFQNIVFHRLNKQKETTRNNIELKFKLAVMEYHDGIK